MAYKVILIFILLTSVVHAEKKQNRSIFFSTQSKNSFENQDYVYVDAIILSEKGWTIWINEIEISNNYEEHKINNDFSIQILDISKNSVKIKVITIQSDNSSTVLDDSEVSNLNLNDQKNTTNSCVDSKTNNFNTLDMQSKRHEQIIVLKVGEVVKLN